MFSSRQLRHAGWERQLSGSVGSLQPSIGCDVPEGDNYGHLHRDGRRESDGELQLYGDSERSPATLDNLPRSHQRHGESAGFGLRGCNLHNSDTDGQLPGCYGELLAGIRLLLPDRVYYGHLYRD